MEYTFGDEYKGGPLILGLHKVGKFYEIVEDGGCKIANSDFNKIRSFTQEFFREKGISHFHKTRQDGILKFFVIRYSFYQNAFMLNLVTPTTTVLTEEIFNEFIDGFCKINLDGKITSFYHTISNSTSDAIKPEEIKKIWGEDHLTEKINDF